jgi:hypothetical protein
MRSLLFDELSLLSVLHKRARRVRFHPRATIFRGDNETGKSALLKSLYAAFGAPPAVVEPPWVAAEVKTLVRFRVDGVSYSILRDGDSYTIFDSEERVRSVHRRIAGGLDEAIADLFDFRLQFSSPSGASRQAPPKYLFAPFYVDQDRGWINAWGSLAKLRAVRRKDTLEYHVGIRPNSYFVAKARLQELQERLQKPKADLDATRRLLASLDARLGQTPVQIDEAAFRGELDELVARATSLQRSQESLRSRIISLQTEQTSLRSQRDLAQKALAEFHADYEFANASPAEVECPTCGTHYQNSIAEVFSIARDEDECADIVARLDDLLQPLAAELEGTEGEFAAIAAQLAELDPLVSSRRDGLTLREVLRAEGQRSVREILEREAAQLQDAAQSIARDVREARGAIRSFEDRNMRKRMLVAYAGALRDNATKLAVSPIPPEMVSVLSPAIHGGGSDLPRMLLAYYVTVLQLIRKSGSSTYCPFVIDSINQQDQAGPNLVRMFELLATGLPAETQLVLACVDTRGVKFEGDVIELTEKYGLLRTEEYASVASVVRPMQEKRFQFEQQLD